MDSLIAFKGEDYVIVAADTTNAYSVLRMKVTCLLSRTMMIKFGILMVKNSWPSVENILMFLSLVTIFKRILHAWSIKMESNSPSTIQLTSSAMSLPKQSEKDHIWSTASWLDLKDLNLDYIGLIT